MLITYGFMSSLGVALAYVAPLAAGMKVYFHELELTFDLIFNTYPFIPSVVPKEERVRQWRNSRWLWVGSIGFQSSSNRLSKSEKPRS